MSGAVKTQRSFFYLGSLFIYILLAGYISLHFDRYISGNDSCLYFSIARKYAAAHFFEAINDYWSPLLSWCLTPLFLLKLDPIVSVRTVEFLAGGLGLVAFLKIIYAFNLSKWLYIFYSLIAILLITYFLVYETPDMLFAAILLWYVYFITKENFLSNTRGAILIGVLGALMYFAKAIGFYFFLAHITCCVAYLLLKQNDAQIKIAKGYLAAMLAFVIIAGIWVAALSFKYHDFTISNAGKYNFAIVGPKNISLYDLQKKSLIHPINTGIYQLADKYSLNCWERPQVSTVNMVWSPFSSIAYFVFFLHLIWQNCLRLYYDFLFKLIFAVWLISILLYVGIKKENPFKEFKIISIVSLAILIIVVYTFIFSVPRYLFPAELLLLIATVYNFNSVITSSGVAISVILLLAGITTIFICKYWVKNIKSYNESTGDCSLAYNDIGKVRDLKLSGSIAALKANYKNSLLSYYTNNPYVGQISADSLRNKNYNPLYKNNVRYLFVWDCNKNEDTLFTNFSTVFFDSTAHLKIFDVTEHK